jgi:hypothetical protein
MTKTSGRDFSAALDWLCLFLPHEQLPNTLTDKAYVAERAMSVIAADLSSLRTQQEQAMEAEAAQDTVYSIYEGAFLSIKSMT